MEAGARLLANPDEKAYTKSAFRDNPGEGTIWMGGENIEEVTICGGGTIDSKTTAYKGGVYDRRPSEAEGTVRGRISGFYLDKAGVVTIRNWSVQWGVHRPAYFAHALEKHGITALQVGQFQWAVSFSGQGKEQAGRSLICVNTCTHDLIYCGCFSRRMFCLS